MKARQVSITSGFFYRRGRVISNLKNSVDREAFTSEERAGAVPSLKHSKKGFGVEGEASSPVLGSIFAKIISSGTGKCLMGFPFNTVFI